jgi:murein L,D-transpeptidase YcbB/YkuD
MKRLLTLICTLLVTAPFAAAFHHGDGSGDGSGWDGEVPQEILDIRAELHALKSALHADREALLATLEGATEEEKIAALSAWREEHEAEFAAIHELAGELRALVEQYRPDMHIEIPPEIQAKRDELRAMRQALAESRREAIAALEDPTDEEIRAAIEAWKAENADAIAAAQDLAREIRQWFRENRPHRPPPEVTQEMHQRRLRFKENIGEVRDLRAQMEGLDPESDEYAALREELRTLLQERKRLMRNKRADEGGVGGDRRPGG